MGVMGRYGSFRGGRAIGGRLSGRVQSRENPFPERGHLGPGHVIAALLGVGGKDEDVIDARFGLRPLEPCHAFSRRTEQAKGVADFFRLDIADVLGDKVIGQVYTSLTQPKQV